MPDKTISQLTGGGAVTNCLVPIAEDAGAGLYLTKRLTPSSNPGVAAALLQTAAAGGISLTSTAKALTMNTSGAHTGNILEI
jgi:hypothetical protein